MRNESPAVCAELEVLLYVMARRETELLNWSEKNRLKTGKAVQEKKLFAGANNNLAMRKRSHNA